MAKKIPSNFYQEVNVRKLNNVFDSGLPSIGSDDNGKVVKVVENKFALSEDLHTTVVANPEGSSTDELMNLKVGDTIYAVNKPTFEYIKGIRLTISDGGQYRTDKPKVEFYDDGGNVVTTPTYTSSCDKEYQGNISLNQVCSIATTDAPGVFTYVFDNTMPVTINHLIKLTNAGAFAGDIAKSVKVELTADGENWLELWFDPSIAWSGSSNAYRIIDIKTGEVSNTLLPIVTSADNGKVLGVVSGVWDKVSLPDRSVKIVECTQSGANITLPSGINLGTLKNYVENNEFFVIKYGTNYYYLLGWDVSTTTYVFEFLRVRPSASYITFTMLSFTGTSTQTYGTSTTFRGALAT